MNEKQDMVEKESFRQAGEDLLRKVREEERVDSRLALSSWQKLEERLNAPRKTSVLRIRYLVSSVAAAVMLLLAVGCYFWIMGHDKSSLPLALLEEKNVGALPGDEILLVKDQGWVQLKDEATVIYDTVGKSNVEEHQIEKNEQETKIDEPDQIIVPKGRRANIVFSDGTKMYINAETRVIFPTVFAKDKREILVDGEVYLEVAADPSRPFIVKTSTIEVKVLGTRFNVCAYRDEPAASVVLVEGLVEVKNGDIVKHAVRQASADNREERVARIAVCLDEHFEIVGHQVAHAERRDAENILLDIVKCDLVCAEKVRKRLQKEQHERSDDRAKGQQRGKILRKEGVGLAPLLLRDENGDERRRADGEEHGDGKERVGEGNREIDGAHGIFVHTDRDHKPVDHGVEREHDL